MASSLLADAAQALLDACAELLGTDAPSVQFLSQGQPTGDEAEYLAVHIDPLQVIAPASVGSTPWAEGQLQQIAGPLTATMVVTIMRESAVIGQDGKPRPADVTSHAARSMTDAYVLICGLRRRFETGELLGEVPASLVGAAAAVPEAGQSEGWQLQVTATIPGYDPEAS